MRVQRSFGFIDLSGFTSFTETRGDEDAVGVLAAMRSRVREVSSRQGVRVAKWLGDGAMFVGVEPGPLVETVLEIELQIDIDESPLALRAGMATGDVILFEGDDYIGTPVNIAARLCDVAGPHEILAVAELRDALPPTADVTGERELTLHGLALPVPVLRVCRRGTHG